MCCLAVVVVSSVLFAEDLGEGLRLFDAGKYAEAKVYFTDHLQSHPDCPEALYYLGRLESDGAASQSYFRTLWSKHPRHGLADDALYAICQYHYAKGYYITAMKMYRDLVSSYPESGYVDDAAYWIGGCYLAIDQPDSALQIFQSFASEYADSDWRGPALLGVGDALFAQGKYQEAIQAYHRLAVSPVDSNFSSAALYRLGQCHERLGEESSAQEQYDRLIEKYPHSLEARLISGRQEEKAVSAVTRREMYTIQVGAFARKENAIRLHDRLARLGYEVSLAAKQGEGGKTLHVVRVGTYDSREAADKVARRIEREEGVQPQVFMKDGN